MDTKHLSVSALSTFNQCQRKYYYANVLRWRPASESQALTFGKAWHALMQHLALACHIKSDMPYESALNTFLGTMGDDTLTGDALCHFLALAVTYQHTFGQLDRITDTEAQFATRLSKRSPWHVTGFIDAMTANSVIEYKTTSRDISEGSFYWMRLKANTQAILYALVANVDTAVYVVARKPSLKRSQVPQLDKDGYKVVIDNATGQRVLNRNFTPRQSAGEGMTLVKRIESDDEYIERMIADINANIDSYFAVKHVYVDAERKMAVWQSFLNFRLQLQALAKEAKKLNRADHAYTRNCTEFNCANCPYAGLCLDIDYNPSNGLPQGFNQR